MNNQKFSFLYDYSEGAHPKILEALSMTNLVQQNGYGEDNYCEEAKYLIKKAINNDQVDVHFVSGGTQANYIVISSALKPYESVISASTGHIHVHETGAVEAKGHKINAIETTDGKITPEQIEKVLIFHTDEHMVRPKMVYISNSTEIGTVYTKSELKKLHLYCKEKGLYLFMDGARLGSALMSPESDLSITDLPELTDAFYIGGTKNGALIGEAIVLCNDNLKNRFRYYIKQNGALLAKGRILGIQFKTLFTDNLFFDNAKHANDMAFKVAEAVKDLEYDFLGEPSSNQIFPILPNHVIDELSKLYQFYVWSKVDEDRSSIRIVTSWATPESEVDSFIADLIRINKQGRL
ncbi:MAG TPA: threonine aldolase [Clostridiales bacterium]|jgi:threonine aldolase|nr:threonine aldolase [Clostridiales bacterium]